jgi:acetyltransferase-like isoleucine patch superfamily enzyme
MRKISAGQILVFALLAALAAALAVITTALLLGRAPLGDFRGVVLVAAAVVLLLAYALLLHRLFLAVFPLQAGEIPPGSRQEFVYHVYLLFYLILFYPVMRSGAMPVPLMRLVYQALGARLGPNTYSSGIILDPRFVEVGSNTIIGQYALIVPHVIENERLAHYPVRIGSNVTVGAHAVVLSDVDIGDGAMVATGAIVPKGTRIAAGEVWGGVPARRLQHAGERR